MMNYEEEEEVVPNCWSNLSTERLKLIVNKVRSSSSLLDFINFGSVCYEWRNFCIHNYQRIRLPGKVPVLLIAHPDLPDYPMADITCSPFLVEKEEEEEEEQEVEEEEDQEEEEEEDQEEENKYKSRRSFYNPIEARVIEHFTVPVRYYKDIRGSSHGWLVTVEECYRTNIYSVELLNPFRVKNNKFKLPRLTRSDPTHTLNTTYYLVKAFLSANPSSLSDPKTELVVLGIFFVNKLAFCRPCDRVWTYMDYKDRPNHWFHDIICYQGQFYAILENGFVFGFIITDAALTVTVQLLPPQENSYRRICAGHVRRYLVESEGELFQIQRHVYIHEDNHETVQFHVYKLDPTNPAKWVKTRNLNDQVFFLGDSITSMSLSALDFPGGMKNSIYYTDDGLFYFITKEGWSPHDIGIFMLEDGTAFLHKGLELDIEPSPIWIQPTL